MAAQGKLLTNQPAQFPMETALAGVRRGPAPNPVLPQATCAVGGKGTFATLLCKPKASPDRLRGYSAYHPKTPCS
ncbi:hypothetical protein NBRC116594_40800 [Shimia sp. NS0008-38b]